MVDNYPKILFRELWVNKKLSMGNVAIQKINRWIKSQVNENYRHKNTGFKSNTMYAWDELMAQAKDAQALFKYANILSVTI